jgi:hypothetical protein
VVLQRNTDINKLKETSRKLKSLMRTFLRMIPVTKQVRDLVRVKRRKNYF